LLAKALQELNLKLSDIASSSAVGSVAGSGIIANLADQVKSGLASLGILIENGIVRLQTLIAGLIRTQDLEIGTADNPSGITIYDKITKQPYCVTLENEEVVKTPGKCGAELPAAELPAAELPAAEVTPVFDTPVPVDQNASSTSDNVGTGTVEQPPAEEPPVEQPPVEQPPSVPVE